MTAIFNVLGVSRKITSFARAIRHNGEQRLWQEKVGKGKLEILYNAMKTSNISGYEVHDIHIAHWRTVAAESLLFSKRFIGTVLTCDEIGRELPSHSILA